MSSIGLIVLFPTWARNTDLLVPMVCLWLFVITVLIVIFWRKETKKNVDADGEYEDEQELVVEEEVTILPCEKEKTTPNNIETVWIKLPHNLYFDEKRGDICYGEDINIHLKDNVLRLFRRFIEAEQFELTFKEICVDVLGRSVQNGINKGDKAVVAYVARCLREALVSLPFIQIEAVRGVGYRMIIARTESPIRSEVKE